MMENWDTETTETDDRMRMNGWAWASVVVLLVFAAFTTLALMTAGLLVLRHDRQRRAQLTTSIIVTSPSFLAGPAVEMSLPAGSDLISATVDTQGGNWWYQNADTGHLHVLIAASKLGTSEPDISNTYFERVIQIVEHSGNDQITGMSTIQSIKAGSYPGRTASYDLQSASGTSQHAVALLLRRESDDLLIVLYGDDSVRGEIDHAAQKMFSTLHPRPTPKEYDVHTALLAPVDMNRPV